MDEPTAEEYAELGRRAVACSAWRWLKRMHTTSGWTVIDIEDDGTLGVVAPYDGPLWIRDLSRSHIPDLSDAATKWLVLELVREHVPGAYLRRVPGGRFEVVGTPARRLWITEAHALVSALEAVSR